VTEPTLAPVPTALPRPALPRRGRRHRLSVAALLFVAALAAFNARWYWLDARPIVAPRTIASWLRAGRHDEAESALRARLRRAPHDGEARLNLARVLGARQDLAGCVAALRQVPDWWPDKAEALYREGTVCLMLDRARDAEAAWLAVVKEDPLHPVRPDVFHDASFELMKLYATEDRWEDAYPVMWRAYDEATTPRDRETLLTWRLRSELERVAPLEALPRLQRFVAAVPDDAEALRALARAEQALGRADDADRDFAALRKLRPDDPRVWRDYLTLLHERGDQDGFTNLLARAPKALENEPEIAKFQGMAREKSGDHAGAADAYRRAIELNPNILEYHHRLALAAARLDRDEEVAAHRKRAQELRTARSGLPKVFAEYFDALNGRNLDRGPDRATTLKNLAAACKTLGMTRASEGWSRLGDGP
jgi:tetratricopeptide (TPR) repeat protein